MVCESKQLDGFGTAAAGTDLFSLADVAGGGVYCGNTGVEVPTGSFRLRMSCTTLDDAADNVHAFASLCAATGRYCSGATWDSVRAACSPTGGSRTGTGTTITQAANNAYAASVSP